jgi:putative PIN family toxin of toxin-antitoxin system
MPNEPPRVVFDCNVFLQGLANRNSPARKALRLFFSGDVTLFVSAAVLAELRDVLNRPRIRRAFPKLNDRTVDALLQKIERQAVFIRNVPEEYHLARDPKDECYINLAIVTSAVCIVSRDKDLLDLTTTATPVALEFQRRYPFLRILRADDFVSAVEQERL